MDYNEDPEPPNREADEWRALALKLKAELKDTENVLKRLGLAREDFAQKQAQLANALDVEKTMRKALWLGHGHSGPALYGDDGEMQCKACGPNWDYRRMPIDQVIETALGTLRQAAMRDNEAMTHGRNALVMWHREGYSVRPTELEQSQAALKELDEALGCSREHALGIK